MRIIDTINVSKKKFAIKMSINFSTTKDIGRIPVSFRAGSGQYIFNQNHAMKKKEIVPRFKKFKRFLNTMRAKKPHDAISWFFAIQDKNQGVQAMAWKNIWTYLELIRAI